MRVLIISAAFPPAQGGVATHVTNLAHGLINLEKNISVCVLTKSESLTTYPALKYGRLQVYKFANRNIQNFSGRLSPFEEIISTILRNWQCNIKLAADLVHAHDLQSAYIGWMLKVAYNIPLVVTVHRAPVLWKINRHRESPKDCFMEAIKLYKLADYLIVPSKASKDVLITQGFPPKKVRVIPHGINYKHLSSYANEGFIKEFLPHDKIRLILCPARADEHKDPTTFVRAAAIIKKNNPDKKLFFLLTGEPERAYCLPDIARRLKLKVGREILFKSFKYSEMPTLYRRASVCVVPSLRESFGQTILESFVFRTPVIVANSTALSEIVMHEVNGLLFNVGSHDDLANQVQKVLDDEELTQNLTQKGLEDIKTKFNVQDMTKNYVNFYRWIVENYKN